MNPLEQPTLFQASELGLSGADALRPLQAKVQYCQKCRLHSTRTHTVFGEGNTTEPLIAFVGEGPGENEDLQGRPFVGKAGGLLDKMLKAMELAREQVYICNVVKCRPPGNRKPEEDEIKACGDFLSQQLRIVQPRVIVALGATAANTLLNSTKPLGNLRGQWHKWEGRPVRVTYHPAFLLRPQGSKHKPEAWTDLQAVMAKLKE